MERERIWAIARSDALLIVSLLAMTATKTKARPINKLELLRSCFNFMSSC